MALSMSSLMQSGKDVITCWAQRSSVKFSLNLFIIKWREIIMITITIHLWKPFSLCSCWTADFPDFGSLFSLGIFLLSILFSHSSSHSGFYLSSPSMLLFSSLQLSCSPVFALGIYHTIHHSFLGTFCSCISSIDPIYIHLNFPRGQLCPLISLCNLPPPLSLLYDGINSTQFLKHQLNLPG